MKRFKPGAEKYGWLWNPTLEVLECCDLTHVGQVLRSATLFPTKEAAETAAVVWADRLETLYANTVEVAR
jgi:hypothetical protein